MALELGVSERQVFIWRSGGGMPRRRFMQKIETLTGGEVRISDHYEACASAFAASAPPRRRAVG